MIFQQVEHVKKPNLIPHIEGVEHIGETHPIEKWPISEDGTVQLKQVQKPNSTSHYHKRAKHVEMLNSTEKAKCEEILNETEEMAVNTKKPCIRDNANVRYVVTACNEILIESEETVMEEEIGEKGRKNRMSGARGRSDTQRKIHEEAYLKDDPILELFDAGWHMKRGKKRGP